jgi:hypothetical protein
MAIATCIIAALVGMVFVANALSNSNSAGTSAATKWDRTVQANSQRAVNAGRQTFRFDTFEDESFWGGALRLHDAIKGSKLGGVGAGVSPKTALSAGLKVDADAIPRQTAQALKAGKINLNDPAVTVSLLKLNAVVGVKGFFDSKGNLTSMGITCALCHSTVDDSFAPGIGKRLDGWANRDLNVGLIVSLAPNLKPVADTLGVDIATVRKVLLAWGPGKFDAELLLDGKGFRPDGKTAAVLIPPAYGLAGFNKHGWIGWDNVTYWNAFVANIEMHGKGRFFDPRLNNPAKFPIAVKNKFYDIDTKPDRITPKLADLHVYQLSIPAPKPPKASFDNAAAHRGKALFNGKAGCKRCHVPPLFTEPGWNLHTGAEIGIDDFQAKRGPENRYRTAPLKGLWAHQKGGFFHDGRFATLLDVVNHYNTFFKRGLTEQEKRDVVEYLKSIPE